MKIPTMLLYRVLLDEGLQVSCTIERDFVEIQNRYQSEGMSFLTITLPTLSEALEKGLARGRITPDDFKGFKPYRRGGSLPALLSGFFMRIFDVDGLLLDHPCIDSIRAIRQVARLFKKVKLPCSKQRIKAAYERYVSNDRQVFSSSDWCSIDPKLFAWVNGHLWSDLEVLSGELYCFPGKFGSGATSERLKFNERHNIREWPIRAELSFPSDYHAAGNSSADRVKSIRFLESDSERPVRVVQVAKTLKTPRTISVEPSYMMLMQQSIAQPLMVYLESKRFPYKSIRFTDQSVNIDMARVGSIDGSLATIDLSDASDLVSNDLVHEMFGKVCPSFLNLVQDCRSTSARLPDSSVVKLRKFASMGSAMCFPIEAMAFFAITCYSLLRQAGGVPSRRRLAALTAKVAVYGDDIIVPTEMVSGLMEDLEAFGLKINREKSFHTGLFRESCGGDYYAGHCVTPIYVRRWDFTGNTRDPSILTAGISLANQFYMKGLWNATRYIRGHFDQQQPIPTSSIPVGCVHHASVLFTGPVRYDSRTYSYSMYGTAVVARRQEDEVCSFEQALSLSFRTKEHSGAKVEFRKNCTSVARARSLENKSVWSDLHDQPDGRDLRRTGIEDPNGMWNDVEPFWAQSYSSFTFESMILTKFWKKLNPAISSDGSSWTSVRPHALKLKRGWSPTKVGS